MSAELLGPPISVGYPIKQVETNPDNNTESGKAIAPSRSIQSLKVSDVSNPSTIAKLKKLTANSFNGSTVADVVPSRSIQPLKVSDVSNSSTIAKLKELTPPETIRGQQRWENSEFPLTGDQGQRGERGEPGMQPVSATVGGSHPQLVAQESPQLQEGDNTGLNDPSSPTQPATTPSQPEVTPQPQSQPLDKIYPPALLR
jgi:hypothetical protein